MSSVRSPSTAPAPSPSSATRTAPSSTLSPAPTPAAAHAAAHAAAAATAPWVVGVDEVGRGPYAGPLYVCAVAFAPAWLSAHADEVREITDSKKYRSHAARTLWSRRIRQWAAESPPALFFSLQSCTAAEITARTTPTRDGVAPSVYALMLATARAVVDAVRAAEPSAVFDVIVDGAYLPPAFAEAKLPTRSMVRADGHVKSVSAASVLAKVAHDEYMMAAHKAYPQYAWDKNMGYGTNSHDAALLVHGLCVEHRPAARTRLRRLQVVVVESAPKTKEAESKEGGEANAKSESTAHAKAETKTWTMREALAIVEKARVHAGRRRTKRVGERE